MCELAVRHVDLIDATSGKHQEVTEEATPVALHQQHLEAVIDGAHDDDGGCVVGLYQGGDRRKVANSTSLSDNPYRDLPAVDDLAASAVSSLPRPLVVDAARATLEGARAEIAAGGTPDPAAELASLIRLLERRSTVRVVNATGVLLHTNLGRATWSARAIEAARLAAGSPTNVEIDLETGDRGRRGAHVTDLLTHLTGAEDAVAVNNNAAALLLTLAALAGGRAVPVSRGELIEIGGSYRLPEVMTAAGATMVEVGTTNRTRPGDYGVALQTYDCAAILKVHPSNYQVDGFTEDVSVGDLADLAAGLPVIHDVGSGLLDGSAHWVPDWLSAEPAVRQSIESGAEIVMFSGDKLLGGPQAGVVVGSRRAMSKIRAHPLARALRVDGVTYAALAATLLAYFESSPLEIPFWRHALADQDQLIERSGQLASAVDGHVEQGFSVVGAGSAPGHQIEGPIIRITDRDDMFGCLLSSDLPVITRRVDGDLVLDLRAVEPEDDEVIVSTISKCR